MQKEAGMITKKIPVDENYNSSTVNELGKIIREGGLVAFPTETVYGLGGNALDATAAKKIYAAKGRPSDNPLIVHVADIEDVPKYVKSISPLEKKLMNAFWPGPLTIVFPKNDIIPFETSGGLDTVAIRCPAHEATRSLIRAAGVPIAGPSANISTRPSPTTADGVMHDMNGKIEAVIDGGMSLIGLESTIIAVKGETILIYRPGGITKEMLSLYGETEMDKAFTSSDEAPKAPGMKYRHYAPSAPLTVYVGDVQKIENHICAYAKQKDKTYGYFVSEETARLIPQEKNIFIWGRRSDKTKFAHHLFPGLLFFNNAPVDKIIAEGTDNRGLGLAIMNRLTKASGFHVIEL